MNDFFAAIGLTGGGRIVAVSSKGESEEAFALRIRDAIYRSALFYDRIDPVSRVMEEHPKAWQQFIDWFSGEESRIPLPWEDWGQKMARKESER